MNKNISLSISKRLLKDIEANIKGKSRSAKLETCIRRGYELLIAEK